MPSCMDKPCKAVGEQSSPDADAHQDDGWAGSIGGDAGKNGSQEHGDAEASGDDQGSQSCPASFADADGGLGKDGQG